MEKLGKYLICDIENLKALQYFCFYNPTTKEWFEFEISEYRNDLYSFIKFYSDNKIDYLVTFNGINYDQPIMEWVYRNYEKWHDLTAKEINLLIYQYGQDVIDNSNHKKNQEFLEKDFTIKPIDLFKIWHYDRPQRSASLKKIEFSVDHPSVEEMPIEHWQESMTEQEIQITKDYCKNDILATETLFKYTIGNTDHSIYKEDNKIELRMTLSEEFGVNLMNASDTKIGDYIIIVEYCKIAGITPDKLPKKGFFRKLIPIKDCIPSYVKFETEQLQKFLDEIKSQNLTQDEEFSKVLQFKGQIYDFKKGGLHNRVMGKSYYSDNDYLILDVDGTGFYPRLMLNNSYYPKHLKKEAFLGALEAIVQKREELKPLAKKDLKIKGIVQGLKISANSVYGKTSDKYSWLFDRLTTMQVTITGQLSLLMLIEAYELAGIQIIMANSDGLSVKVHKNKLNKMKEINDWWMNTTKINLEETEFDFMIFSTVNDYIAKKTSGEIKVKGDLLIDTELHGDKSRRIVRLALNDYFLKGIPVKETIKNHKNIYDFCIGVKSSSDYHFDLVDQKSGERKVLKKMVRYYISNEGQVILKMKNPESTKSGNNESHCESRDKVGRMYQPLVTYFNTFEEKNIEDYNINYDYYIYQAESFLYKINYGKKPKKPKIPTTGMGSLF